MKLLEKNPAVYDRRMRFITLGRVDMIKEDIVSRWIKPGQRVLEIGCGTGSLAAMINKKGARVTGIDISEDMLEIARGNAPMARFIHMTAVEIDRFRGSGFDCIVATLSLSELTEDEIDIVLEESAKILKDKGRLIIADEVVPEKLWQRLLSRAIRIPLTVVTYILAQETSHPLRDIVKKLTGSGFQVIYTKDYLLGTLRMVVAEKK
jgi:demethylmenaquinone methyltransferase/2-methoxy-6-polyprenyl-1,4-benzoquinol methylase